MTDTSSKPRLTLDRVGEWFDTLLLLPENERSNRLAMSDLHPADRDLLSRMLLQESERTSGFLDQSAETLIVKLEPTPDMAVMAESLIGRRFGSFELVSLIGQGGMASVFEARRVGADFDQAVAVKVLKRGLYSEVEQKLFRRERQLLAQLNHPNVARLIDGGVAEPGIPFLVLELIDGKHIDRYAAEARLDVRERVQLFLAACKGVEAAHQGLIIHRDLKPSNILVTSRGEPKLLDFGVAALLDASTGDSRHSTLIGALTPGYAAPEQLNGERIGTATDVYALGVVLRQLLTGVHPQKGVAVSSTPQPSQQTLDVAGVPVSLERIKQELRGDLGRIIAKATDDRMERRYASASALIEDLRRWLAGEPVRAHPSSSLYYLGKFVRRHAVAVTVATALSLGILTASAVALYQARVAYQESVRAGAVRDFVMRLFDSADASKAPDDRPTPTDIVKQGLAEIRADTRIDDFVRADMLAVLIRVQSSIGDDRALGLDELTKELIELSDRIHEPGTDSWVESRALRAASLSKQRLYEEASSLLDPMIPELLASCKASHLSPMLTAILAKASAPGRDKTQIEELYENLREWVIRCDLDPEKSFSVLTAEANFLVSVHEFSDGLEIAEQALAYRDRHALPESDVLVWLYGSVGSAATSLGDVKRGEQAYREAIRVANSLSDSPTQEKAWTVGTLGSFLVAESRIEEARPFLAQALDMRIRLYGQESREVVYSRNASARALMLIGDYGKAIEVLEPGIAWCERDAIVDESCIRAYAGRARAYASQDNVEAALGDIDKAIEFQSSIETEPGPLVASQLVTKAAIQRRFGLLEEAIENAARAERLFQDAGGGYWTDVVTLELERAWALSDLKRIVEADQALSALVSKYTSGDRQTPRLDFLVQLVSAVVANAKGDESLARTHARKALELAQRPVGADASSLDILHSIADSQ